ncbi:TlpA family protein disulfide reductase [Neisseriaceae bacterium JH1-16]|nr:TlpA family protein disulfide reductase [Neisseriaceae bacterium JH1-16]
MRHIGRRWLQFLLFTLTALLVACSTGDRVPNLSFTPLDGKPMTFEQLQGKVVFVNFWATSCAACIEEMPALSRLQKQYGTQGFRIVAVAMDFDQLPYVRNFSKQNALPFMVAHDTDGKLAQGFGGIMATPTSFLIDKQGRIIKRYMGKPDMTALAPEIETQLHK